MAWTHARISEEYLEKLQVLAALSKRSSTKQIELFIDTAFEEVGITLG